MPTTETPRRVASRAGVDATTILDPQPPAAAAILGRSREHDLLVIGAPRTSWLANPIAGGVAKVALREFTTPMMSPAGGREGR